MLLLRSFTRLTNKSASLHSTTIKCTPLNRSYAGSRAFSTDAKDTATSEETVTKTVHKEKETPVGSLISDLIRVQSLKIMW